MNIFRELFLVLIFLVPGYSNASEFRIPVRSLPKAINPSDVSGVGSALIYKQIFDNLYEFDGSNSLRPRLAQSHTITSDGKRIRIRLHTDTVFSDGSALKALDVKNSLLEVLNVFRGKLKWAFGDLENFQKIVSQKEIREFPGLKIISDRELEFNFVRPFPGFLQVLAAPYFNIFKKVEEQKIGTGAYIRSSVGKREVILTLSDKNTIENKSPTQLIFKLVENPDKEIEMLRNGEIDIAQISRGNSIPTIDGFSEIKFKYLQAMILMLNLKSNIFKSEKIRCDFSNSFGSALEETDYRWSPLSLGVPLSWDLYSDSKDKAVLLNNSIKIKILYSNTMGILNEENNLKISEKLKTEKYDIRFEAKSFQAMKAEMRSGEAQALLIGFVPDYLDADALLAPIIGTGEQFNFSGFSDLRVDNFLSQSRNSFDKKSKTLIYRKLFTLISKQCPAKFLGTVSMNYLISKKWNFPNFSSFGFHTLRFIEVRDSLAEVSAL